MPGVIGGLVAAKTPAVFADDDAVLADDDAIGIGFDLPPESALAVM